MSLTLLRKQKGISSVDISERLGISQGHYSHLENGSRKFTEDLKIKLAEILEVPISTIENEISYIESKAFYSNSWISKIKIWDLPVTDAFLNDLRFNPMREKNKEELTFRFVEFVEKNIRGALMSELNKDGEILDYFLNKI